MVAITINGTVTLDESLSLQTGTDPTNVNDGNDVALSVMSSSIDPDVVAFYNRLFGASQLNQSSAFATANGIARSASNFIAIDAQGGTISGLGFDNGSGVPLTTYGGVPANGLLVPNVTAVNGGAVYLFADSVLGNKAALGYDATGNLVFALLLDPNAGMTQAQVWMVQFEAISNPIFPSNYDEGVNLFDTIGVSASATTQFAFDALPSGNNYFGMVGTTTNALVVVGADPDPVDNGDGTFGFSNDSDTVNTSKGGGSVTIGINDQNFNPGEGAYFTYVSGADTDFVGKALDANEADDVSNIQFGSRIEVGAASTKVVQVSGDALAIMTIKCFNGNDTADGTAFGLSSPSALGTGSVVAILKIEVLNALNQVIRTLTGADLVQDANGAYVVGDLNDNYSVKWYTKVGANGAVHDQTLIGSGNGEKFDIGAFGIDQPNAARADIGNQVIFEDDGPQVTLANTANLIRVDETIGQNGGAEDDSTSLGRITVSGSDLFTTTQDYGTDGAAATGSSIYSLKVGAANADVDSGLDDTVTGSNVMLHWVDAQTVEGRVGATTTVAFTISINAGNGAVTVDLARALVHGNAADPDESATPLSIDASKLFAVRTVKDGDLDTAAAQVDLGPRINYEDDGPTSSLSLNAVAIRVDESVGQNSGEDESASLGKVTVLGSALFTAGAAAYGSDGAKASGSDLYSFRIASELVDSGIDDTLTGANILLHKVDDQTIEGRLQGGTTVAFVMTINATSGDVSVDLKRALEHDDPDDFDESGTSSLSIDASKLFAVRTLTDKDLDTHKAEVDIGPSFKFEDDGPGFASQIASATIDGGDKNPISHSLNGLSGSDSPAHYTINKWSPLTGYTAVPNDAGDNVTVVDYLITGTTTLAFRLAVSDTNTLADPDDNSGMYTFTNYLDPPIARQEFDFTFFPSGQSLFGVLLDDDQQNAQHPASGLLVVGQNVVLDSKGAYLGGTDTINTSQGGGAVTIGVNNQMFDPGDGAVFVYLSNPDRSSCATASKSDGLTQTSSDDADVLDFGGTLETKGASIEIVQRQGSDPLGMKLTCYDLSDDGNHDAAFDPLSTKTRKIASDDIGQSRSWMDHPNGDVLSSGAFAKIDSIKVYDTGVATPKAEFTINKNTGVVTVITGGGVTVVADQDHDGDYDADDFVTIVGFQDNDTIAFTSDTVHDAVLVEGWSGAWDVGGFNIEQGLDAPDIDLSFSVAITDGDGDIEYGYDTTFDDFSIRLDGTGANNDPNNDPPDDFASSYDGKPAPLTVMDSDISRLYASDSYDGKPDLLMSVMYPDMSRIIPTDMLF
jgi:hypothetical protein